MKIKGTILSLLGLLSISFSAFALVTNCPPPVYFNNFPMLGDQVFVPGLGPGRLVFDKSSPVFGDWVVTEISLSRVFCYYKATGPNYRLFRFVTDSSGWKPHNPELWLPDNSDCDVSESSCQVSDT